MELRRVHLWLSALLLAGCPGPEPRHAIDDDGGVSSPDLDGGASGGPDPDEADGAAADADTEADAALGCSEGDRVCFGNEPAQCDALGTWVREPACVGAAAVCNGGTCGRYRLIGGVGPAGNFAGTPTLRLTADAVESAPRLCTANLCVTGGIRP